MGINGTQNWKTNGKQNYRWKNILSGMKKYNNIIITDADYNEGYTFYYNSIPQENKLDLLLQ